MSIKTVNRALEEPKAAKKQFLGWSHLFAWASDDTLRLHREPTANIERYDTLRSQEMRHAS